MIGPRKQWIAKVVIGIEVFCILGSIKYSEKDSHCRKP